MHFTSIHITDEHQAFLDNRRMKLRVSMANQIRDALDDYMKKHKEEK